MHLFDSFTPEARAVIVDDDNWSKKHMMESCALCKKPFGEHYVPLHLWKKDSHWTISFHMKCAFGDRVVESLDDEFDEDYF